MNAEPVIARLKKFEGEISWLYRCTGGETTIGVGHAILTSNDALQLNWQTISSTDRPSDGVIDLDYHRVSAAPKGQVAKDYEQLTTIRMSDQAITALLQSDIDLFSLHLNRELVGWEEYPEPAQEAIFDMAYNLGVIGLLKFHRMLNACSEGDWATAAAESHRNGIPDERNEEIRQLFLNADAATEV